MCRKIMLILGIVAVLLAACGGKRPPNGPETGTTVAVLSDDNSNQPARAAKPVAGSRYQAQLPRIDIEPPNGRYSLGAVINLKWSYTGLAEDMKIRVDLYRGTTWIKNIVVDYPVGKGGVGVNLDGIEPNRVYKLKISSSGVSPYVESWSRDFDVVGIQAPGWPTDTAQPALNKNDADIYFQITRDGFPFVQPPTVVPTYYSVRIQRAISGTGKISHSYYARVDMDGKAVIRLSSEDGRSINGYYRAEFAWSTEEGTSHPIGQWSSIPINGGKILNIELPIGEQARMHTSESQPIFKLWIGLDASTPVSHKLKMGEVNQTVTVLRVANVADFDIPLHRLGLRLDGDMPLERVLKVTVWDGAVKIGEGVFAQSRRYALVVFETSRWLPADSRGLFTIEVDLAEIISFEVAKYNGRTLAVNYDTEHPENTRGVDPRTAAVIYADATGYMQVPKHTVVAE